jgi:hypothetical protein
MRWRSRLAEGVEVMKLAVYTSTRFFREAFFPFELVVRRSRVALGCSRRTIRRER